MFAIRANRRFPRAFEGPPVQIYSTPLDFSSLALSPDARRAFFAAGQERRELVRYDGRRGQFAPFLSGVQGRSVSFSKTGVDRLRDRAGRCAVAQPAGWQRAFAGDVSHDARGPALLVAGRNAYRF